MLRLRERTFLFDRTNAAMIACALMVSFFVGRLSAQSDQAWAPLAQDIRLAADQSHQWTENGKRYVLLEGDALIEQGLRRVRANTAVLWMSDEDQSSPLKELNVIASGNVRIDGPGRASEKKSELIERLQTKAKLILPTKLVKEAPSKLPAIVGKAQTLTAQLPLATVTSEGNNSSLIDPLGTASPISADGSLSKTADAAVFRTKENAAAEIQPVQSLQGSPNFGGPTDGSTGPLAVPSENRPTPSIQGNPGAVTVPSIVPNTATNAGVRRIRFLPRTSQPFGMSSSMAPDGIYRQWIFTGGINIVIEEVANGNVVDIVADRAVLWTRGDGGMDPASGEMQSDGSREVEIYLEGNVYVRQGNPSKPLDSMNVVVTGKQVYFNVNTNQALAIDGAVETQDAKLNIPLIMTSEEVRQLAPGEYYGKNAQFTTSVYRGVPGYAIQGREIYFDEIKERIKNPFTRQDVVDTQTGQPMEVTRHFATAYNNIFRVNDFPVFYWPYVRANAEDPLGPLQNFRVGQSRNLGVMGSVSLDVWDLVGLDYLPIADKTNWLLDIGYYSKRGINVGSRYNFLGRGMFREDDTYWGNTLGWYINDHGLDQLGPGRMNLVPSTVDRGRFHYQGRYDYNDDAYVIAEVSYLSDSNVLESFFENEYDAGKDQDTILYGKYSRDNWALTGLVQPRLRNWLPQNQWLPRVDGWLIGQSLLDDKLTYFTHSSLAYGTLEYPVNYELPGDETFNLGRVDTRHEIDMPFHIGSLNVTPFVMGDFAGYTEAMNGVNGLGRLYGSAGVRTSIPFYRIYSNVQSDLFNLNGLAHKITLNADYTYAYSTQNYTSLPLMDQLDDDTSDMVRRENYLRTFNGFYPTWYDTRFQAIRRGIIFYPEAMDSLNVARFSATQRLQTKRGPANNLRIMDWMYLDMGASLFPQANQNNLGNAWGLIDYNYRWNIGDRTSIQSNGLYEPANDTVQAGGGFYFQRPPRSQLSILFSHYTSGPFSSDYIGFGSAYRLSNRYSGYFEIGKDLQAAQSVNVRASFARIGLDYVTTMGIVWNAGRNDLGFELSILPRVGVRSRYGRSAMPALPFGIEPATQAFPMSTPRQAILNQQPSMDPFSNTY
jgi:hypothetical protein